MVDSGKNLGKETAKDSEKNPRIFQEKILEVIQKQSRYD